MPEPWTAVENRHRSGSGRFARFLTAPHRPWKTLRVSHIPTAPAIVIFSSQNNTERTLTRSTPHNRPLGSSFDENMLLARKDGRAREQSLLAGSLVPEIVHELET